MGTLLLTDIGELLTAAGPATEGAEARLGLVHGAVVLVVDGRVRYAGPAAGLGEQDLLGLPGLVRRSAGGRLVTPGLCDPHTHPLWAGERSLEFDLRNQGKSYAELQAAGGGILSTVRATTAATDEELVAGTRRRLGRLLRQGVTRCEGKTGYGLWPKEELRQLRLLQQAMAGEIGQRLPRLRPTFLCHVPPPGLSAREREALLAELAGTLPAAAQQGAKAVDVYCDQGAFTLAETAGLLGTARRAGLGLRCHAEQFTHTGAARLAAELGALSVEHLEEIDDAGVRALAAAGTVANLLPGAVLTLRLRWPDARRLLAAGARVALGTDLNPGSSLTESLPLMMMLGCAQMGLRCAEAWLAVTTEACAALGSGEDGALRAGSCGDLVVWDADNHREVCQHFGVPLVREVYLGGERVV